MYERTIHTDKGNISFSDFESMTWDEQDNWLDAHDVRPGYHADLAKITKDVPGTYNHLEIAGLLLEDEDE